MAFNTTKNLSHVTAKSMFNYLKENFHSTYFFMGKASKYGPGAGDTKLDIDTNTDLHKDFYKELLILYKIDKNAFSLCYDRINWTLNTIHNEYGGAHSDKCYVITDNYNIYKCIANNEDSPSLYKPTHTTYEIKDYKDGYKWKFLYTLTSLERRAFLSATKIPFPAIINKNSYIDMVQFNAVPGTIDAVKIINPGSNYTNQDIVTITGNGTGATGRVISQNGLLKRIEITSPGQDYTYASISITGKGILGETKAIISPFAGHGSDLAKELNVNAIMINSKTLNYNNDITHIPKTFDYRKIGLITSYNTDVADDLISGLYKIRVENSTPFIINTHITLNGKKAFLVFKEIVLGEHYVYVSETDENVINNNLLNTNITQLQNTTTITTKILEVVHAKKINKNFNILYSENLSKNTCVDHELDIFRIVLEF